MPPQDGNCSASRPRHTRCHPERAGCFIGSQSRWPTSATEAFVPGTNWSQRPACCSHTHMRGAYHCIFDQLAALTGQLSDGFLLRLDIPRPIKITVNVFGNLPSCIRPQPLRRHPECHEGPSRSLLDKIRNPFGGDHARGEPNVTTWGDRPRLANSASIDASNYQSTKALNFSRSGRREGGSRITPADDARLLALFVNPFGAHTTA